ncbi:MAG TPA: VWA domain-containing protein [Vicinamibacterales bacterium]|nr:VWA domain-containing protein [Vicinamibacterales bacterium]
MTRIGRRAVCLRIGAMATAPLWPFWDASASQEQPIDRRALPFRTRIDLVHLSVTARDAASGLVHNLDIAEFEIYEDGVRQDVGHFGHHETPISVVLLLDKSGSMAGDKMMHAKDGVIEFVKALKKDDEVLVVAFSDSVDALGGFGLGVRTIEQAVKQVEVESQTRLYDAVIEGAREIAAPGRKDKRALVILSDGEDNASRATLDDAVDGVRVAEVPVYAIAVEYEDRGAWYARRPTANWRQLRGAGEVAPLRRLTDGTGGWTYSIPAAKRCKEVCLRIADELRNQYLLGYYPTNQDRDGRWRAIEVRTSRPGVILATRAGYYAPRSV